MKRDLDLIRKMVFALEDAPTGFAPGSLDFDGYTPDQVAYHAHLMIEAGLAKGARTTHMRSSGPEASLTSLTWEGHEFADAARDESRWTKAKAVVTEKAGTVTLAVLSQVLLQLMKNAVGL
jgi:Hypothetical protein (DUF2513)